MGDSSQANSCVALQQRARSEHQRPSLNDGHIGTSIRDIRRSMSNLPSEPTKNIDTQRNPAKRKNLLLIGLFSKEPSMVALEQFAETMQTSRSSGPGKTMPYVNSRKMPEHVPKVNARWDGIPEAIHRKAKNRPRAIRNSTIVPSMAKPQSTAIVSSPDEHRRSSATGSWDSQSSSSRPESGNRYHREANSMYSFSSIESNQISQTATVQAKSSPSISEPMPPSLTTFCISKEPTTIAGSTQNAGILSVVEGMRTALVSPKPVEPFPKHVISSLQESGKSGMVVKQKLATPVAMASPDTDAFLAGEALPLQLPDEISSHRTSILTRSMHSRPGAYIRYIVEKRPDSSRHRLGLKANMIMRNDAAPWEAYEALPSSHMTDHKVKGAGR